METVWLKIMGVLDAPAAVLIVAFYGLVWAIRKVNGFIVDWRIQKGDVSTLKSDVGILKRDVKSLKERYDRDIPEMKAQIKMLFLKFYPEARSAETGSPMPPPKSDALAPTTAPAPASEKT